MCLAKNVDDVNYIIDSLDFVNFPDVSGLAKSYRIIISEL